MNVYVKNLDATIDDEGLRKEFSPFGTITSAKVVMEGMRSKGFGFVCFSTPDEAIEAISEMNGRIVGTKPLYAALAESKKIRKARLTSQYMQRMNNIRLNSLSSMPTPPQRSYLVPQLGTITRWTAQAQVRPGTQGTAAAYFNTQNALTAVTMPPNQSAAMRNSISNMLLEIDVYDLLHMLEQNESLKAKVEEALAILQSLEAKQKTKK